MDLANRIAKLNMVNCRKHSPNQYRIYAMGSTTGESWFSSRQGQSFSLHHRFHTSPVVPQPPIQWVPVAVSEEVK